MNILIVYFIVILLLSLSMIHSLRSFSKRPNAALLSPMRASFIRYVTSSVNGFTIDSSSFPLTVEKAHKLAAKWLEQQDVPEASESSRHLIMHAAELGTRYSDFQKNIHKVLNSTQKSCFEHLVQQRAQRVPVQYLVGNWDFFGLQITCQQPILIPRPETEELVERSLQELKRLQKTPLDVLDVGAGTGAIGIAICAQMLEKTHVTAIDINPQAVKLAQQNAQSNLKDPERYLVIESDFLSFAKKTVHGNRKLFDMIVSNPPYIPSSQLSGLQTEVGYYEDQLALDGGVEGLDIIVQLIEWGGKLLSPEGSRVMWLEVDTSHPALITRLFFDDKQKRDVCGIDSVDCFSDLSGNPRFVRVRFVKYV